MLRTRKQQAIAHRLRTANHKASLFVDNDDDEHLAGASRLLMRANWGHQREEVAILRLWMQPGSRVDDP